MSTVDSKNYAESLPPPPQPTRDERLDTPDRLCEYNPDLISGCKRTMTILALEAEFDTYVSPEMVWGHFDTYCIHEGDFYYSKEKLKKLCEDDIENYKEIENDPRYQSYLEKSIKVFGSDILKPLTYEKLVSIIKSEIKGKPSFVEETPQFIRLKGVGNNIITPDMIDGNLLKIFKTSFDDNINPLLNVINDRFVLHEGQIYCPHLYLFAENPLGKLGFFWMDETTSKFYSFDDLTPEQEEVIKLIAINETENKRLSIIYL